MKQQALNLDQNTPQEQLYYEVVPTTTVGQVGVHSFTYSFPADQPLARGQICKIPFRRQTLYGVIWQDPTPEKPEYRVRRIAEPLDLPPVPESVLEFCQWVATYSLSSTGQVLKMALPVKEALEAPSLEIVYGIANKNGGVPDIPMTKARQRVLEYLAENPWKTNKDIRSAINVSASVIKGLEDREVLVGRPQAIEKVFPTPFSKNLGITYTEEQTQAIGKIKKTVGNATFQPVLIDGVTGAGKTEVYFEGMIEALQQPGQILVLLPEIALSTQWLERFKQKFGVYPAVWHSDLTPAQRRQTWRAIVQGNAKVIVGARSALFLPYPKLSLIVVDEEHESSYKQEEGVIYHGRDMAVVRAHQANCPILLASATPSIESLQNVAAGKYEQIQLRQRATGASLPDIHLVDMRELPKSQECWISGPLADQVTKTLDRGEQALLFLNRRGYSPLQLCQDCGYRIECPSCSTWMVEHKLYDQLLCHQCGYQVEKPRACPGCGEADSLRALGPGVERIQEEAQKLFPDARIAVLSSDTLTSPSAAAALFEQIRDSKIDLLIGTQLIAKGHHFPNLTLIGVVDADLGVSGPDFRAAERTYQLLHQVSGRAGRAEKPGSVYLQTYTPDHPVLKALIEGERDAFNQQEIQAREMMRWPPFGSLAAFIVSGPNEQETLRTAQEMAAKAPVHDRLMVLGPAPAPLYKVRQKYRFRLLLKAEKGVHIQQVIKDWLAQVTPPRKVRIQTDIDPYSFF